MLQWVLSGDVYGQAVNWPSRTLYKLIVYNEALEVEENVDGWEDFVHKDMLQFKQDIFNIPIAQTKYMYKISSFLHTYSAYLWTSSLFSGTSLTSTSSMSASVTSGETSMSVKGVLKFECEPPRPSLPSCNVAVLARWQTLFYSEVRYRNKIFLGRNNDKLQVNIIKWINFLCFMQNYKLIIDYSLIVQHMDILSEYPPV
jgi:hypothetical protein